MKRRLFTALLALLMISTLCVGAFAYDYMNPPEPGAAEGYVETYQTWDSRAMIAGNWTIETSYTFDNDGRILTRTETEENANLPEANGTSTYLYEYDAEGRLSRTVQEDGNHEFVYTYRDDGTHLLTYTWWSDDESRDNPYVNYRTYDPCEGWYWFGKWQFTYDEHGNTTRRWNDGSSDWVYENTYDDAGRLTKVTMTSQSDGVQTYQTYTYNDDGSWVKFWGSRTGGEEFTYNADGQLVKYDDLYSEAGAWTYEYDEHGNNIRRSYGSGEYTAEKTFAYMPVPAPLTITAQPQDFEGPVGASAVFSITAEGDGLTYQWQYMDPGGTWKNSSFKTDTMSCKVTAARDGRQYRCIVSDAYGREITSDPATITVKATLAITQQPQDFTGSVGDTATFTVAATGDGLKYQWQYKDPGKNWANSSFKTASISCKITAERDGRQYRCIVSDASGDRVTSDPAAITVKPGLVITQQPQNYVGKVGSTAVFSVTATGEGLTYRWQYQDVGGKWTNSSFKTASMSCKLTAARDGRQYRCVITDTSGHKLYSEPASMTIAKPVTITAQPQDFTGKIGATATFKVAAQGDGLTYQWQYREPGGDWAKSSFKTDTASCKITAARDGRQYRCIVTDAWGNTVTSEAAAIIVAG